jgi:ABC-2 type transport system ATP-binding protein
VHPGEFIHLQGENGAGKSTLLNLILGLQQPNSGKVKVFGCSPTESISRSRVGCMLQKARVPDYLTVRELIELVRSYYSEPLATDEILQRANLVEKQRCPANVLSGGQERSLYFALAIAGNPDLLILDEPTTHLDQDARAQFWKQVKDFAEQGKAILVVTHVSSDCDDFADAVTRTLVLEKGTVQEPSSNQSKKIIQKSYLDSINAGPLPQPLLKMVAGQLKVEFLELIRKPMFITVALAFYAMAFLLPQAFQQSALPILAGVAAFNIIFTSVEKFGIRIAAERENGWVRLLRVTPLPPWVYLAAKVLTVLMISMVGVGMMFIIAAIRLDLHQSWIEWLKLFSTLIVGSFLFAVIGCVLGYLFNAKSVSMAGVGVLILAIFTSLPFEGAAFLRWIPFSPFYHYGQLLLWAVSSSTAADTTISAISEVLAPTHSHWLLSLGWLVWTGIVSSFLAIWAYQRDPLVAKP